MSVNVRDVHDDLFLHYDSVVSTMALITVKHMMILKTYFCDDLHD
jgi:hypothetical protein